MDIYKTDPEFIERFEHFAYNEIVRDESQNLPTKERYLAILAVLIGCQGVDAYRQQLIKALDSGITPIMVREVVYQSVDYVGYGKMLPFLTATNEVFLQRGISLPLDKQSTTTFDDRLEKGVEIQAAIFGDQMKEAWKNGHINRYLASNCFGDYYTRKGLSLGEREMITFCLLMAQGGCEPQLTAHAKGNMNIGNNKDFLIRVVYQCLPYIGYPRSLNAITCIQRAVES